nr:hypothetical protein OG409_08010 [Streptomyces sp. NBC_00974]
MIALCGTCGAAAVVQWRRSKGKTNDTEPVFGCADHALTPDLATQLHEGSCTGPGKAGICSCKPRQDFDRFDTPKGPARRLPPGW